eukprot:7982629-Pyramimonas_sp.AAC.1
MQVLFSSEDSPSSFPVEGECHLAVRHEGWASAIRDAEIINDDYETTIPRRLRRELEKTVRALFAAESGKSGGEQQERLGQQTPPRDEVQEISTRARCPGSSACPPSTPSSPSQDSSSLLPSLLSRRELDRRRKEGLSRGMMEVFSPPRICPAARRLGVADQGSLDLSTGWDFRLSKDRRLAKDLIRSRRPGVLFLEPPCRVFSVAFEISKNVMDPAKRARAMIEGMALLRFAIELAELQ